MKAIIAAGGKGTRLYPLTYTSNKHMLPIANKALLLYPFEDIVSVGIKEIGIIVNETRPSIEKLIGDGSNWGARVTYIDQPIAMGLAHVVKISEKFINGDSFVYHLGDNIFTQGIKRPYSKFVKSKSDAMLTMIEHQENYRLGVPFFDEDGKLIRVVEKPENPPNRFGIPGLYMFGPKVFEAFKGKDQIKPSARGELEIVDLYNYMIKKGYKVEVAELEGEWRDPGKFDDSLETNKLIMDLNKRTEINGKVDKDSKLADGVVLGKGSTVTNSQILGPVIIGDNVEIRNSYIGPYTAIGDSCEIVNAKIEYSILLPDVHLVDVRGKIQASMIGSHTEIRQTKERVPVYSFMVADHCRIDLPF
ncbi:glucose-1-phosphate thymidylyltransferase [Patescibacteria group bacterium]|nr:glucose-1-phosphate thymidylyltransferase [Patescibacteria group bacterium]